jgi:sigma-B regulation protein RsbQ
MPISPLTRNNVHVLGNTSSSRSMVFAHGFGTTQVSWHEVVGSFLEDYRVILYDNVGASEATLPYYDVQRYSSLHAYSRDLEALSDELEVQDGFYVGHSVSGMVGVLTASRRPDLFERMALVGASPRYVNDVEVGYAGGFSRQDLDHLFSAMESNYYSWIGGFAPMVMDNPEQPNLAEQFAESLKGIQPDIALHVARIIFLSDHRKELKFCHTPCCVIQSTRDIAVPRGAAEYLANNLPNGHLRMIEAVGHLPHVSAAEEVKAVLREYFREEVLV